MRLVLGSFNPSHQPPNFPFKDPNQEPDLLRTPPKAVLKVVYGGENEVKPGSTRLTPDQVKSAPEVTWDGEEGSLYTLMMVDPDAPSRKNPIRRSWLHWLVVNIPGSDLASGEKYAEYAGAAPIQGSGYHRYVVLLYKQADKISDSDYPVKSRGKWSVKKFTTDHQLGDPVAGTFYEAQNGNTESGL